MLRGILPRVNDELFGGRMAEAARELGEESVEGTLRVAVRLAVDVVSGCDAAAVTISRRRDKWETPAYNGAMAVHGDRLQYEVGQGPCIDAAWEQHLVLSPDLATETRWPRWAPRVVKEVGARSMMCLQLFTSADALGALNFYSTRVHAFDDRGDQVEAEALAAHAAVALASAQESAGLHVALANRTVIGQAEGMLMHRFGIDGNQAFQVLRRMSSVSNTKLHVVATELVRTRRFPNEVPNLPDGA